MLPIGILEERRPSYRWWRREKAPYEEWVLIVHYGDHWKHLANVADVRRRRGRSGWALGHATHYSDGWFSLPSRSTPTHRTRREAMRAAEAFFRLTKRPPHWTKPTVWSGRYEGNGFPYPPEKKKGRRKVVQAKPHLLATRLMADAKTRYLQVP